MPDYTYDFESSAAEYFWTHNIEVISIARVVGIFVYYKTDDGIYCTTSNDDVLMKHVDGQFEIVVSAWEGVEV